MFFFFIFFVTPFCPGSFSGTAMDTNISNIPMEPLQHVNSTFRELVNIVFHLRGQIPQKPPKKGRERPFSSQTRKTLKVAYYPNYCIDSNQILHSDKDQQMLFVGGLNTRKTNPRWRKAAILKNRKSQKLDRSAQNLAC